MSNLPADELNARYDPMNRDELIAECERLRTYVEDILTKDRLKTREINILTPENRKLRAALTISRGQWIHSVNAAQCLEALGESPVTRTKEHG